MCSAAGERGTNLSKSFVILGFRYIGIRVCCQAEATRDRRADRTRLFRHSSGGFGGAERSELKWVPHVSVGMIQCGGGLRFALEADKSLRILGNLVRQELRDSGRSFARKVEKNRALTRILFRAFTQVTLEHRNALPHEQQSACQRAW